jgi:hypothetical protein
MFGARFGPTLRMPTLLYFAGVPGEAKPAIRSNVTAAGADDETAARVANEIASAAPSLRMTREIYTSASAFSRPLRIASLSCLWSLSLVSA